MTYTWADMIESIRPYADRPVGTIRIDTDDIRLILAQAEEVADALKPFAALAEWITVNKPDRYNPADEVQIEGWLYTLSVGDLQRALYLYKTIAHEPA